MAYDGHRRCYFRRVDRSGSVAGWFGRSGEAGCPWLVGYRSGYLGVDGTVPLKRSSDLSRPRQPVPVGADDPGRQPRSGDVYVGSCADLSEEDDIWAGEDPARDGCAYAPSAHTFFRVPRLLALDTRGRTWAAGPSGTVVVSDGTTRWRSARLPASPDVVLTSSGDIAAVLLDDAETSLFVTDDAGRTWRRVTGVPQAARRAQQENMLADGRLLLGPADGQLWRATDASNTSFTALEAGPLTTVLAAGDRVYGLADQAPERALQGMAWVSKDGGSTWRQVLDPRRTIHATQPVPADELKPVRRPAAADLVKRLRPNDVAVTGNGLVLVTYGVPFQGRRTAWRLFDRRDDIVAQGLDGNAVERAGNGFLLWTTSGFRFVDAAGRLTHVSVEDAPARRVRVGDVFVPGVSGVFRPGDAMVFPGLSEPDGVVSTADGAGRLWALGRHTGGRTVVRWAYPGRPWRSRDLGPSLRASGVQGEGSTLMVVGLRRMYVSGDSGKTWNLVRHGASEYGGGPPHFWVLPDGSIVGGDERAGYRISSDLRTFRDAPQDKILVPMVGALFVRGSRTVPEVSRDRRHWERFNPDAARRLLVGQQGAH